MTSSPSLTSTLTGHSGAVLCLKLLLEPNILASGSADRTVIIWDWQTSQRLNTLNHTDSVNTIEALSNHKIVTGSRDKRILVWNWLTGDQLAELTGNTNAITSFFFHDLKILISSSSDSYLRAYNVSSSSLKISNRFKQTNTSGICFGRSANDKLVYVNSDSYFYAFNPVSLNMSIVFYKPLTTTYSASMITLFDLENTRFLLASSGGVHVYRPSSLDYKLSGHTYAYSLLLINSELLLSGCVYGNIKLWNWKNKNILRSTNAHNTTITAMEIIADGSLCSSSDDKTLKVILKILTIIPITENF